MTAYGKWRVVINGIEFAHHASPSLKHFWTGAVRGLGRGDIRTTSFVNSGTAGGYVGDQFPGLREIPIDLFIFSRDSVELETLVRQFSNLTPNNSIVDVKFITPRNRTFFVRGAKIVECDPVISDTQSLVDYKVTLLCGDPVFYDVTNAALQQVELKKEVVGGISWDEDGLSWDVDGISWDEGEPNAIAVNTGSVPALPTIQVLGKVTNPVFRNKTTGREISVTIATDSTNEILINHLERTIVLNPVYDDDGNVIDAANIYNNLNSDDFWSLAVGRNEIVYATDSAEDDAVIWLKWHNGYSEIL